LGLWLNHTAEKVLGDVLGHYMNEPHILSSIKSAMHTIVTGISLMQSQNINLCLAVERAICPPLLKKLQQLLSEVLVVGLDHDADA